MGSVSGTLATMGCAVPYAMAAKFAYPERPAIALAGDGAVQMNSLAELITIAKYWQRWQDPRLVVMVPNNRDLAFVTWEERIQAGDPKWESSQSVPDVPYAAFAKQIGLGEQRVERPAKLEAAWDAALTADRPFVLDIVCDPNVPPLPPHITRKQARNFMGALLGDPEAGNVIADTARELIGSILPGKKTEFSGEEARRTVQAAFFMGAGDRSPRFAGAPRADTPESAINPAKPRLASTGGTHAIRWPLQGADPPPALPWARFSPPLSMTGCGARLGAGGWEKSGHGGQHSGHEARRASE